MAPAVPKPKIVHVVKISAQSEQLQQRYDCFTGFFLKKMHYWSSSLNKSCSNEKKSVNKVVIKSKIAHVVKISAQSEHLQQRYDCF